MKLLYAVMYTVSAFFDGRLYANGKVTLTALTELEIAAFDGQVNRVDALGFNPHNDMEQTGLSTEQLTALLTRLVEQDANEVLGIFSYAQLHWAYANHPSFKPSPVSGEQ